MTQTHSVKPNKIFKNIPPTPITLNPETHWMKTLDSRRQYKESGSPNSTLVTEIVSNWCISLLKLFHNSCLFSFPPLLSARRWQPANGTPQSDSLSSLIYAWRRDLKREPAIGLFLVSSQGLQKSIKNKICMEYRYTTAARSWYFQYNEERRLQKYTYSDQNDLYGEKVCK